MTKPLRGKRRLSKSIERDLNRIRFDAHSYYSAAIAYPEAGRQVYRVHLRTITNEVEVREYASLEEAQLAAEALTKAREDERVRRFKELLDRQERELTGRSACLRAAALLDNLALVLPARIVNEDLSDFLEDINRRGREGQSSFKIYFRTAAATFWVIANAVGYLVRTVVARKSA
jgi:hypothetical protein